MSAQPMNVLVVDDDEIDVEGIRRLFRKHKKNVRMRVARDGLEALAVLRGDDPPPLERPYLILLDINMPRMNGHEFLHRIRNDPEFRAATVYILTTSDTRRDMERAEKGDVAGYFVKGRQDAELLSALDEAMG